MRTKRPRRALLAVWIAVVLALGTVTPAAAQAEPCADLSIADISFNPAQPIQGQSATISVTVQNTGCATQGFVVQFKQNPLAPSGPSVAVSGLGENESTVVNFDFSFPEDGNQLTLVQIDTANDINETNEANNLEIAPVTVVPATTDLAVTDISLSPSQPVATRVTTASITVENSGNTDAGPFRVQWKPSFFTPAYSTLVDSLAAGRSTVVTFDHTYPFRGTFDGWARVDTDGQVSETNEFNNLLERSVDVDPPLPDLSVQNAAISPANPVPGEVATMTITVQNTGHEDASNFRVQWKPGPFVPALSEQLNELEVGATTDVVFNYTYPFTATFNGTIRVDPFFQVPEVDESNNTRNVAVTTSPNEIDLTITDTTISPSPPTQGETATVEVTVENQGNTPAGDFMVSWNPDSLGIIVPSPSTLTKQVLGLQPGQSTVVTFTYDYPEHGNFRSVASVDSQNNILESNEANNLDILNVTVDPAPIDLIITDFTLNPASPIRTAETTADITVQNDGPFPTEAFAVQWRLNEDNEFGPTEFVPGLNPGQSTTVTLTGTYFATEDLTTAAVVDVFDQVVEPEPGAEDNNIETMNISVQPTSATLRVTLNSLFVHEAGEDGVDGNAEWDPIVFGVLDPGASCSAFGENIPDLQCTTSSDGAVEDGDPIGINDSIEVTLEDFTPLVAAVTVLEDDGISSAPEFMGLATVVSFPPEYLELGTFDVEGTDCEESGDGNCFRANFTVTVLDSVP